MRRALKQSAKAEALEQLVELGNSDDCKRS